MLERNTTPTAKKITIQPKILVLIIVAIVIIVIVLSSFFVVDQTEQSVVLRFGRFNRIVGPGLQYKWPLGIEKNLNVPTQVIQTMSFGYRTEKSGINTIFDTKDYPEESIMLTGDLNIIDVEWVIQYKIKDPYAWLFNLKDKSATIRDISQSVLNEKIGDLPILSVLGSSRTNIEVSSQQQIQDILDSYGLGIRIVTIKLKNIVPPKGEVQDAFEDVNKAIQDMERLINEGKEQYNREIPKARGEAAKLIEVAKGYASERINEAKGDVDRYNAVHDAYLESKEVTSKRLYVEIMGDLLASGNTTIIDKDLDNFLPLQNLSTTGDTK